MIDLPALISALAKIYGPEKGQQICMTILPGILADFKRMLQRAAPGTVIREEYRTEDGRAVIELTGNRTLAGEEKMAASVKRTGV